MQGSFERCSSFGHARPGGIWRDGFEELNWVAYDRLLLLGERSPKLGQGDILQLPDPSLVTPNFLPTSSRVFGLPPSDPNRWKIIFRSRSSNTSKSALSSSRMFLSLNNSNGVCASSSPTISLNSVESSSLIGASRDAGRIETVFNCETLPLEIPISSASSSSVGSRPNSSLIWSETRLIFEILSTRWTGSRIVLLWFASARLIDCLIHQAA